MEAFIASGEFGKDFQSRSPSVPEKRACMVFRARLPFWIATPCLVKVASALKLSNWRPSTLKRLAVTCPEIAGAVRLPVTLPAKLASPPCNWTGGRELPGIAANRSSRSVVVRATFNCLPTEPSTLSRECGRCEKRLSNREIVPCTRIIRGQVTGNGDSMRSRSNGKLCLRRETAETGVQVSRNVDWPGKQTIVGQSLCPAARIAFPRSRCLRSPRT